MSHVSEALTEMYRTGKHIKPVMTNKMTRGRVKQYEAIKETTGEDPLSELNYSMQLIKEGVPQIQRYVLSQNETPAPNIEQLTTQAYKLRCRQINDTAKAMDIPQHEAEVWIEMDESEDETLESAAADSHLGSLFAPIGIAATRLEQKRKKGLAYDPAYSEPDTLDPNLALGIVNTIGQKVTSADLKRAAQNKPAGILGFLGTGGTSHYDALRKYFQQNPNVAAQVINGTITDESQLPNWSSGLPSGANAVNSNDLTNAVAQYQTQQQIKKYLPVILIGLVVIVLVIVLITKGASRNK
jgi:hypothetical protein